jgi:hypothetical protein
VFRRYIVYVLTKFTIIFSRTSRTQSGDRAKVAFFNSLKIHDMFDFLME